MAPRRATSASSPLGGAPTWGGGGAPPPPPTRGGGAPSTLEQRGIGSSRLGLGAADLARSAGRRSFCQIKGGAERMAAAVDPLSREAARHRPTGRWRPRFTARSQIWADPMGLRRRGPDLRWRWADRWGGMIWIREACDEVAAVSDGRAARSEEVKEWRRAGMASMSMAMSTSGEAIRER